MSLITIITQLNLSDVNKTSTSKSVQLDRFKMFTAFTLNYLSRNFNDPEVLRVAILLKFGHAHVIVLLVNFVTILIVFNTIYRRALT